MALVDAAHGSVTTDGTVQTLNSASFTTSGVYVLGVDLTLMVNADEVEIIVSTKVLTGGSEAVYSRHRFLHAQGPKVWQTVPLLSPYSISFTVQRVAGTDHAYPWAVYTL